MDTREDQKTTPTPEAEEKTLLVKEDSSALPGQEPSAVRASEEAPSPSEAAVSAPQEAAPSQKEAKPEETAGEPLPTSEVPVPAPAEGAVPEEYMEGAACTPVEMQTAIKARPPQKKPEPRPARAKKKRRPLGFTRTPTKGQRGAVIIGALISALAVAGFLLAAVYLYSYTQYTAAYILLAAIVPFAVALFVCLIFYLSLLKLPLPPSRKPSVQKRNRVLMYIVPLLIFILLTTGSGLGVSYFSELEVEDFTFIASGKEKEEIRAISARYTAGLWGEPDRAKAELLAEDLLEAPEGLYYKDIKYNDRQRKSNWQTLEHLERLYAMICGYGETLIAGDENIRGTVLRTLDYWLAMDFISADERANKIDVPRYLTDIGMMLKPYLSVNRVGRMKTVIKRGSLSIGAFNGLNKWKGAFLAEAALNSMRYSFFAEKPYLFKKSLARLNGTLVITEGSAEGIKPDNTFYQNGAQAATSGYGAVYFCDVAAVAVLVEGTSFRLGEEKLALLTDFALYGLRYAYRGMLSNHLFNGVFYSRSGGNSAGAVKSAIGQLLTLERMPKKEQLHAFYLSFDDVSLSPDETKYLSYARTLVDSAPDYYMAVKGAYAGFISSERINDENILGRNLSYGGMTLYQATGNEYENMSAYWDFSMIPGTTAFYETDDALKKYTGGAGSYSYGSSTTHSGGYADGVAGVLYVDIVNEEGLYCRQAYFIYDGMTVSLGTSLKCTDTKRFRTVYTTIDQTYAVHTKYKDTEMKVSSKIEDELPSQIVKAVRDNAAVYNGAFAYYNLCDAELTAVAVAVTGSLSRNSPNELGGSTENIFKLYYDFGTRPENVSFAYAVRANLQGDAPATGEGLPIVNIVNNDTVQAVEYADGTAIVVFHAAGSYVTRSGQTLSAQEEGIRIARAG